MVCVNYEQCYEWLVSAAEEAGSEAEKAKILGKDIRKQINKSKKHKFSEKVLT
jgi:hypothetical protein